MRIQFTDDEVRKVEDLRAFLEEWSAGVTAEEAETERLGQLVYAVETLNINAQDLLEKGDILGYER